MTILIALSFFWFLRTLRIIFFHAYLWQLKEYHIGRFLDHFRTEKGRWLVWNPLKILKFILIPGFFFYPGFFTLTLGFFYIAESLIFLRDILRKSLKRPVITSKTILILTASVLFAALAFVFILYFYGGNLVNFAFLLLIFDIASPIFVAMVVLFLQPLAVLARYKIINKAREKRAEFPDLLVIGVTGSYGKTSVKEFLYAVLSTKFNVLATKEHQNSEIGISQCILNELKPEHEIFICEMGAYGRGGIKLLCSIARPGIGILTGISEQHMSTFGSLEKIIKTKYELIEFLPKKGLAVFNGDNPHCLELYKMTEKPKRLYQTRNTRVDLKPDLWAENIKVERDSISFRAVSKNGDEANFKVNLLGIQNILNIFGAAVISQELGMKLSEIARACERIKPELSAMKLKQGTNGLNIIDSTYSANPDGVVSALEYLKIWPVKKVIVMPSLIELGKASKEVHKKIGEKIAEVADLAIITTKDRFSEIKQGATKKGMWVENILFMENPREIALKIKSFCKAGDVVLLESRVPKELIRLLGI